MADGTHIEWTDATWNIITGCSVVSAGCKHCYAMKLAGTRLAHHPSREGLTIDTAAGPVWNGEVRFNDRWLLQPLDWTRPRRIFVCAHGDLFHESVPDEWICAVFAIMASAPQHTFQVLTKRPQRARRWFERMRDRATAEGYLHECLKGRMGYDHPRRPAVNLAAWPLPNVWLGVSIEDQAAADDRVIHLLRTPAAVRWVSAEPLLGPVRLWLLGELDHEEDSAGAEVYALSGTRAIPDCDWKSTRLDWVVVGGESGPGARPLNPQWVRDLRDQCFTNRVPFLFKQWGAWMPTIQDGDSVKLVFAPGAPRGPAQPAFHEWPEGGGSARVGKRAAGRLLDGIEHNAFPEVRHG